METVNFLQMKDGSKEDYLLLQDLEHHYIRELPDRLLLALERLDDSLQGYQVSRLEHSLQTASRAQDDGADLETIVAALVHDLGDELSPENHSQVAASILRPYVRAEVTWIVEMHGLFQTQYYAHHYGKDPQAYLAYKDHPWFDSCQAFCQRYDQAAFDPAYPSKSLAHFEPMLREVFSRKPFEASTLKERIGH